MDAIVWIMAFILSVSAQFGKHVYVKHHYTWGEAQKHCRDNFIDLSPISTEMDEQVLKTAAIGEVDQKFWIGLYRNGSRWMWSGGGQATYTPWDATQPDAKEDENVVVVCWDVCEWNGWHNSHAQNQRPFFCFNLIVVERKRTWESAMYYCKKNHNALTSLTSETEHLLALKEIQQEYITEWVWIGLRFLPDRWLWVNGDPLVYQAWPQGDQDHQCPKSKRCGALNKKGVWENRDCHEQLHFICF